VDPSARILSLCVYIQTMPGEFAPVHSGYCTSLQALQWRYRQSSKGVRLPPEVTSHVNKPNFDLPFSWTGIDVTRKQT